MADENFVFNILVEYVKLLIVFQIDPGPLLALFLLCRIDTRRF